MASCIQMPYGEGIASWEGTVACFLFTKAVH
jgi:hypothetical protein